MNARFLGTHKGKRYYRFTVLVECNVGAHPKAPDILAQVKQWFHVISDSATEALWLIKDELGPVLVAPTEFTTWGPGAPERSFCGVKLRGKQRGFTNRGPGKEHHHFMGWESLIGSRILETRKGEQLCFPKSEA